MLWRIPDCRQAGVYQLKNKKYAHEKGYVIGCGGCDVANSQLP